MEIHLFRVVPKIKIESSDNNSKSGMVRFISGKYQIYLIIALLMNFQHIFSLTLIFNEASTVVASLKL